MELVIDNLTRGSVQAVEHVRTGTLESFSRFSSGLEESLTKLVESARELLDSSAETGGRLNQGVTKLVTLLEKQNLQASQNVQQMSETMESSVQRTSALVKELDHLTQALKVQLTGYRESSGKIAQASGALESSAGHMVTFSEKSHSAMETLHKLVVTLDTQAKLSDEKVSQMRQVSGEFSRTTAHLAGALGNLESQTKSYFSRVQEELNRYHQTVSGSLKEYLSKFDELLSRACKQLGSTVDDLRDPLEELGELISAARGTDGKKD